MKKVKRCISIFLSFILTFVSVYEINAIKNMNGKSNQIKANKSEAMEFYKKSSELIEKNWNDNYFKSIKLKIGKDYLTKDDEGKKVKLSSEVYKEDDVIMVPVNEIVNLTGGKISKKNEDIKINYFGNSVELKDESKEIEVNDKSKAVGGEVNIDNKSIVVPIDVLSKGMGYTYKYDKKSNEIEIESPYQTMRLIVKLKNNSTDLSKYKASETIKGLNNIVVLQFKSIEDTKSVCEQIKKDNIAVYVEPDCYISMPTNKEKMVNSESTAFNSWGVKYIEADKYANYLKNQNINSAINVGVVDSGIDYNHTYFKNRISNSGYDFVNYDNDPYDDYGHGTHVSGTIVDCTPKLNIDILPVKVLDSEGRGTGLNTANGIEYAANNGADVINFSIAMDFHWDYIHEVIENALDNNVVCVLSAGNNNNNTYYECPSDMSKPIVVSAINALGEKCYFSNYGKTIDVAAPGEDIYSAYPGGEYINMSGTSMAAPHVSAVCAMYRLKYPNLNVYEIEDLIHKNTKDLGIKGWDKNFGYGVPHLSLAIPGNEKPVISGVSAKSNSYNSIKLTWNKLNGVNGYEIYRSTSKNGKYSLKKNITSASISSYTNTSLITGKTYYYKIRAYKISNNKKIYGNFSSIVSAKPQLSTPSITLSSGSKKAYIKWKKIAGASGYEIYRATSRSGKYSKIKNITSASITSYTNSKLTSKKTYYYKMRAYKNVSGKKVYSSFSALKYIKIK